MYFPSGEQLCAQLLQTHTFAEVSASSSDLVKNAIVGWSEAHSSGCQLPGRNVGERNEGGS